MGEERAETLLPAGLDLPRVTTWLLVASLVAAVVGVTFALAPVFWSGMGAGVLVLVLSRVAWLVEFHRAHRDCECCEGRR
ncbi:MAG: hypothetical protein FWD18_08295 [Micrococcales bacterium]|nr:hypothetical protein [Micrococcales bacterium]